MTIIGSMDPVFESFFNLCIILAVNRGEAFTRVKSGG